MRVIGEKVQFDYRPFRVNSIEDLNSADDQPTLTHEALLDLARQDGRVLIQAPGGSGKTTTLARFGEHARNRGLAVEEVNVLEWSARDFELDLLREQIIAAGSGGSETCLVLVDGINEVDPSLAQLLFELLDLVVGQYPSLAVVVSDRLNRRNVDLKRWALVSLTLVPLVQMSKLLPNSAVEGTYSDSQRLPYYVDLALENSGGSRSQQQHDFLVNHGGVGPEYLDKLARFAYEQYSSSGSRRIDLGELDRAIGEVASESLIAAGTVIVDPIPRFRHHLVSDYLASRHLVTHPNLWDYIGFNALTFKGASFDPLGMLLEQAPQSADLLLRAVYDWNHYAAGHLLAENQAVHAISEPLAIAVEAMLAEKLFDTLPATRNQVRDSLEEIDSPSSREMLTARDRDELSRMILVLGEVFAQKQEWFGRWCELYTGTGEPAEAVGLLRSADSLVGWTASNYLRRVQLPPPVA